MSRVTPMFLLLTTVYGSSLYPDGEVGGTIGIGVMDLSRRSSV